MCAEILPLNAASIYSYVSNISSIILSYVRASFISKKKNYIILACFSLFKNKHCPIYNAKTIALHVNNVRVISREFSPSAILRA